MKPRYIPGVPVHLEDQAVFDAVDTMRRHVKSCLARTHVKGRIFQRFAGTRRRYAFWLLQRYAHIGALLRGEAPAPEHFPISRWERREVVRFLRRLLRRSMAFNDTLYRVFEHRGRSNVAIASRTKGRRLVIPLRGRGVIRGNIRIVWDPMRSTAVVHMP